MSKLIAEIYELNGGKLQILTKKERETWPTSHFVNNKPSGTIQNATPLWNEEGGPDRDRAPQRCRSSQRAVNQGRRKGRQQGKLRSALAGSIPPRVNSEACGRESFSCRKLEIKPKVLIMKWNQARGGEVNFPRSCSKCQSRDLNSSLPSPSYTSFSFSRNRAFMYLLSLADSTNARS